MTDHDAHNSDIPDWDIEFNLPRSPDWIRPTAAIQVPDLRTRRVIVGLPGHGWRIDLRADAPIVQGSRTFVPVLPEHEWYRAEFEQTEVFAPLIPIERVWVELTIPPDAAPHRGDIISRLVSLDQPPLKVPIPARQMPALTGRRIVKISVSEDGKSIETRSLRAVTEAHNTADGDICVRVCPELEWYRWAWRGQSPQTLAVPVHLLWIE